MPCHCEGLIKAIDTYLAKEDDELELALEAAGYVDAPETIEHIASLEDGIAVVLISETDYILASLKDRIDLEEYFSEVWPEIKKKRFVFGIVETTPRRAQKALFRRIGKSAYKWRYSIKKIPSNWRNPPNPNWPRK